MCDCSYDTPVTQALSVCVRDTVCEHSGVEALISLLPREKERESEERVLLECLRNVLCGHNVNRETACECGLGAYLIKSLGEMDLKQCEDGGICQQRCLSLIRCLCNYAGEYHTRTSIFLSIHPSISHWRTHKGTTQTNKEINNRDVQSLLVNIRDSTVWSERDTSLFQSLLTVHPSWEPVTFYLSSPHRTHVHTNTQHSWLHLSGVVRTNDPCYLCLRTERQFVTYLAAVGVRMRLYSVILCWLWAHCTEFKSKLPSSVNEQAITGLANNNMNHRLLACQPIPSII